MKEGNGWLNDARCSMTVSPAVIVSVWRFGFLPTPRRILFNYFLEEQKMKKKIENIVKNSKNRRMISLPPSLEKNDNGILFKIVMKFIIIKRIFEKFRLI